MKKDEGSKNEIIKFKGADLNIQFPKNNQLNKNETDRIESAITNNLIADHQNKTYINAKGLPKILSTDNPGARKFLSGLNQSEKIETEGQHYASTRGVLDELNKRSEEPRTMMELEKYDHTINSINAARNAQDLRNARVIESDRIRKGRKNLTNEVMKERNIDSCEVTGEKLGPSNPAHGHHIERAQDEPRKALNKDNIAIVGKKVHEEIHKNNIDDSKKFNTFKDAHKRK